MKTSELIAILQAAQAEHGDLEVVYSAFDGQCDDWHVPVDTLKAKTCDGSIHWTSRPTGLVLELSTD